MKKLAAVPLILLLFAVPAVTQAQYTEDEGGLMLGPRLGYYQANEAEDGSFLFGLQLRSHISKYFGLELAATYRTTSEFTFTGGSVKTALVPITGSALIYLPISEHFKPYGLAGLGAYYTFYDTEGLAEKLAKDFDGKFTFGYHLGAGIEIPLNEGVAINVDYRYLFLDQDSSEDEFQPDLSGHLISAGLMFYL